MSATATDARDRAATDGTDGVATPVATKSIEDHPDRHLYGRAADDKPLENTYGEAISADQFAKINEFREVVGDVWASQQWRTIEAYHRFLVARDWNVEAAEEQYRRAMAWRMENRVDSILDWYSEPEVMRRFFPTGICGLDHTGHPILLERTGQLDIAGIGAAMGIHGFFRWIAFYHERQERHMWETARSRAAGQFHRMNVIVDLEGLNSGHCSSSTLEVLKKRTRLEEAMYPEVICRCALVRAPTIFAAAWTVVQHFVDAGTRSKMSISSSGSGLDQTMTPDCIPSFLGGTLEVDELTCAGGSVPALFYVGPDGQGSDFEVPAGRAAVIRVALAAGEAAHVSFRVHEGGDIGFHAAFHPESDAATASAPEPEVEYLTIADANATLGPAVAVPTGPGAVRETPPPEVVAKADIPAIPDGEVVTSAERTEVGRGWMAGSGPPGAYHMQMRDSRARRPAAGGAATGGAAAGASGDAPTAVQGVSAAGSLTLVFDNTYSWFSRKRILLRVLVAPSAESAT